MASFRTFQEIVGILKRFPSNNPVKNTLEILENDNMIIHQLSRNDVNLLMEGAYYYIQAAEDFNIISKAESFRLRTITQMHFEHFKEVKKLLKVK